MFIELVEEPARRVAKKAVRLLSLVAPLGYEPDHSGVSKRQKAWSSPKVFVRIMYIMLNRPINGGL